MKKRLLTLLATVSLVLLLTPAVAWAVETTQAQATSTTQTTTSDPKAELQARVEKRKTELKIKLTTAQKTRLQSKCKPSQAILGTVKSRSLTAETKHGEVYNNTASKLTELSEKLKNRNADTTELDAAITTLKGKVTTYTDDLAVYKQAISDLLDIDCATDPDGFKASLEAARAALANVHKDATDIRTYIKDTIKPLLATIRTQLDASKKTEGSN